MSSLKVYNSYTRHKDVFESITPGHVGLYVCGPTVSGESHLGHARPYITFDVIYRYLMHLGYKVRYVRNITDAGHFEEEGGKPKIRLQKRPLSKNSSRWSWCRNIPICFTGPCGSSITLIRALNQRPRVISSNRYP